jgi:2-C-methyl-D-erythritol 4-phosphate cytidylyltransferase
VEARIILSQEQVLAVVPIRPGNPTATLTIGGRSVLDGTIRALRAVPTIGPIVLALEGVDAASCLSAIERPEDLNLAVTATRVNRWQAIEAALDLTHRSDIILLHDPDRPLVSAAGITDLLAQSQPYEATLTAMPVHGTIKRVEAGRIVGTVKRESLRVSQTPWVFRREVLARALRQAIDERWAPVDELQLARAAGIQVHLADGHGYNVPITSRADARFAEMAVDWRRVPFAGALTVPT